MNICVLYHDGFSQHEIGVCLSQLKNENVYFTAIEDRPYRTNGKQRVIPDKTIDELDAEEIDLFIIPGGAESYEEIINYEPLRKLILELHKRKKYIAGICYGADILEEFEVTKEENEMNSNSKYSKLYQVLVDKNDINIVRRENIIIAGGGGFIEFGMELGKLMGVYNSDEEAMKEYKRLKNPSFIYSTNSKFCLLYK